MRVNKIKILHAHRIYYNVAPQYLQSDFNLVSNIHSYNTRSSINTFFIPRVFSYGMSSFYYTAAKLWNSIPNNLRLINVDKRNDFKFKLKQHLLSSFVQESHSDFLL